MTRYPKKKHVDVDSVKAWLSSIEGRVIPPEDSSLYAIAKLIVENHDRLRHLENHYDDLHQGLDSCVSDLNSVDMVINNLCDTYMDLAEKKAKRERIQ